MSALPEARAISRQWVEKAEHDLKNAEHTLVLGNDCPFDTVCFHAHQCVEKYLKAVLTTSGVDFPRTHDLTELHRRLPTRLRTTIPIADLAELNPYAIEARYPGPWEPQSRDNAVRAVEIAHRAREVLRKRFPEDAL